LPNADPNLSFSVATKHLFRHLHDARALRTNPLVRHLFVLPAHGARRREQDAAGLARVHRLVREAAQRERNALAAAGNEERAERCQEIVARQCLARRSIREVAAELGISYQHCYRERAEICRRIAHDISVRGDAPTLQYRAEFDEFRFLLNRTKRRAASGDLDAAFDESRALVRVAPTVSGKIEALRVGALASLRTGDVERARDAHAVAQRLLDSDLEEPLALRGVARASVALLACDLAYDRADTLEALQMAERATASLEPWHEHAPAHAGELYVESLLEFGAALWNRGLLEEGYDSIARAQAQLERVRATSSQLRSRVAAGLWRVRNHLLVSSKAWYPAWQRANGLTAAFEEAYASGAPLEAADALVALVQCHAFAGHDAEALRAARFAVWLASQQSSERIRTQTAIQLAMVLLWTRHWKYGLSLLGNAGTPSCDAYHAELTEYFAVERAFRRGAFSDAWKLAGRDGFKAGYPGLQLRIRLVASAAAHELGRRRDAHRLIEEALPAAERFGSAPILRDAYDAAARITGDSRFSRQAGEVSRVLTA